MGLNVRKARILCNDFTNTLGSKKITWTEVFETEQDIIDSLKNIYVPENRIHEANIFTGYAYIYSFATYVQKGWTLSEKQMTQAKRLAVEIKKAEICSTCYENKE